MAAVAQAILLNIPGTPASAASTLDGFPLARQGLAGRAMGISTTGSGFGTLFGTLFLALFAPSFGEFALQFGSYEFFWVALFGIVIAGTLSGGDALKGYIAGSPRPVRRDDRAGGQPRLSRASPSAMRDLAGGIWPAPGAGRRLRRCRGAVGDARRPRRRRCRATIDSVIPRLRDVAQLLEHHPALRRARHLHRRHARARRGHRRLDLLCRRQARQQGEREIRQGQRSRG